MAITMMMTVIPVDIAFIPGSVLSPACTARHNESQTGNGLGLAPVR
jgi:hypothetical protein